MSYEEQRRPTVLKKKKKSFSSDVDKHQQSSRFDKQRFNTQIKFIINFLENSRTTQDAEAISKKTQKFHSFFTVLQWRYLANGSP